MARSGSFALQLTRASKEIMEAVTLRQRWIIFELAKAIVMDSPVDKGTFRGNWRFSFNHDQQQLNRQDPSGATVLGELQSFINGYNSGEMWLLNGMRYGTKLEYGYSRKAPGGMVRRNIARINSIVGRVR